MTRPSLTISFPTETDVPAVPLDDHRRDDAGRPIDPERYQRLLEREAAEQGDGLRVERFTFPDAPDLVCLRVVDARGRIRGITGFEWEVLEPDMDERMIARVRRGKIPSLRLVG